MSGLHSSLSSLNLLHFANNAALIASVNRLLIDAGYNIVELNDNRPWGAYFRIDSKQVGKFIEEFFPGLTVEQAQMGNMDAELSPKILLVFPGQRISWQYHNRRAERWIFLTRGGYQHSYSDEEVPVTWVNPGDTLQINVTDRHRLVAEAHANTVVAEIWQHTNMEQPSDEEDLVRVSDDYGRKTGNLGH